MRVPLSWLREYCDPELDAEGVAERLTMTGTKVEAVHHHGVCEAERFIVGRVLDVQPHRDAERLQVCKVDLGDGDRRPATIVCGAPNVAAGQTVAVARPGAVMPDGTRLDVRELRGVVSEGMILAESELGLGSDGAGILVLDELVLDAGPHRSGAVPRPGTPLADLLPIATEVLELEVTPNRPDCLAVYGVARELHAATGAGLAAAPWLADPGSTGALAGAEVEVQCPELCHRFTARVFDQVAVAPSPPWLRARLLAAGQRPINNVVDITNYVMLLTGQPLHAFDLDRVAGRRLVVRRAHDGEQVQTLDGATRTLDQQMVVIDDEQGPTSIAGVMGGARSEVAHDTRRVLLEVANWEGPNIHRSSTLLGLRSEASARFEKGLAPEQCMHAQAVASQLLLSCCGARVATGTIDLVWRPALPQRLKLRSSRVQAILGVPVAVAREAEILQRLDFAVERDGEDLLVTVPAERRRDITREIDLIEEVARIDGLERVPAMLPARRTASARLDHRQLVRRRAEDLLADKGLNEIAGWSFADPELFERLRLPAGHEMRRAVRLSNPMSEVQSVMRTTLLGSLLDAARHNAAHNGPDVAIFESGTVFGAGGAGGAGVHEHHALGALISGALAPRSWRDTPPQADFFSAKALLEALLGALRVRFGLAAASWPFLHPGRSATVLTGSGVEDPSPLGFLGELHPSVAQAWNLPSAAAFSLDLGRIAGATPRDLEFEQFPAVPPLRQDVAVSLAQDVAVDELLAAVRAAAGDVLEEVRVFDVYAGEQVGAGRRSIALALTFRDRKRTLTDEDVAPVRARIMAALEQLGGELRG